MASVSALLPVYNGAAHVAKALDSIFAQTRPPDEVVVVDDGSQDNTAEVVSAYSVRLIQQENRGIGATRQRLVEEARGDWVAFCDHDDHWAPTKLAAQLARAEDPEVVLVHTHHVFYWPNGRQNAIRYRPSAASVALDHLLPDNQLSTSAVLVRREALLAAGGFRAGLNKAEDWDAWIRVAAKGRFEVVEEELTFNLERENSASDPSAGWYAGEREVLERSLLRSFDQTFASYDRAVRDRLRPMIRRKLAAIASLEGEALDREGRREEARERHREAIRLRPTSPGAWRRFVQHLRLKS